MNILSTTGALTPGTELDNTKTVPGRMRPERISDTEVDEYPFHHRGADAGDGTGIGEKK